MIWGCDGGIHDAGGGGASGEDDDGDGDDDDGGNEVLVSVWVGGISGRWRSLSYTEIKTF